MKVQIFKGLGPFPIEMMRIDKCYPKTQGDVNEIYCSIIEQDRPVFRQVSVINESGEYHHAQWAVFGWVSFDPPVKKEPEFSK